MGSARLLTPVAAAFGGLMGFGGTTNATPPPVGDATLMIVLDASESMLGDDANGDSRVESARTALSEVVAGLAPTDRVGLRVFGATIAGAATPGACQDSQLVAPVGVDNRDALATAVDEYAPHGEAPTGFALEQAVGDLDTEGQHSILLVSAGESNCDPEPCAVARELAARDVNLTINVVGLNASATARTQLRCVAAAGHGAYFDAHDSTTLVAAMDRLAARAFRPFAVVGTPVTGAPTVDDAPELVAGQYTDTVGAVGETQGYLIRRTAIRSSIHVGFATPLGQRSATDERGPDQVFLELSTADGDYCAGEDPEIIEFEWTMLTAQLDVWADPDDGDDPCLDDEVLVLTVTFEYWEAEVVGQPFELVVEEEPALAPGAVLQDAVAWGEVRWQPMASDGAAGPVVGGSSFNDAPRVGPGSFTTDLLPGESAVFRVPLEWGQWLQAQADFAATLPAYDKDVSVSITLISPYRGDVTEPSMVGMEATWYDQLYSDGPTQLASSTPQVRWWNRADPAGPVNASVPGDYYVAISATAGPDGESFIIPFTLTLGVFGTAGQGTPPYVNAPMGTPVSSATAPTATSTAVGAAATTTTTAPAATAQALDGNGRAAGEGAPPLVIGALGVAGLGLVGRGAYLLRRNGRAAA